jgi:hypothetical protein
MHRTRNVSIAVIVIIAAAVGFFGFTSPGHRVLSSLGFATACNAPQC